MLDRGITDTGGTRVDVLTSISYSTALSQIAGALKHQYRVVYARPEQLIPPERIEASPVKDGVIDLRRSGPRPEGALTWIAANS